MERRKMLKTGLGFLGITSLISLLYPFAKFFSPPGSKLKRSVLSIPKEDVPPGSSMEVLVNNAPVVIVNRQGQGYVAYSRVCTHMGCLISFNREEKVFICPCHAGRFNLEGNVIAGPAPRPLDKVPLTISNDTIILG